MKALFADLVRFRTLRNIGILAILGLVVHLILPQITSLEHSWQVMKSLIPWAVVLALVAQVLSYLGSGYLLQMVLSLTHEPIRLWRSSLIVLGAASVGMVAGGMIGSSAAIYRWTSQEEGHSEGATLASILPALFNNLVLVVVSLFGVAHLLLVHDLSRAQLVGFIAILLILGSLIGAAVLALQHWERAEAALVWISSLPPRLRRKAYDPATTRVFAQSLFSAWDNLRNGTWRGVVSGAILNVIFDMSTLYLLFIAAGHAVSPGVLLAGYGLPLLLGKMAFVVPGGIGVVEGSMAALYNGLGVPGPVTVVVVLGYRLISFWLPSLSGFPIAAYLQRSK